ncbi:MAG: pantoate--beta-alanine ligase [Halieaceae bacterium]|jgi:pantoate--beta-alanine ligase|nr:pantoate--beta-alanine ligase [Halieaceae bacterium]MDG1932278.1 pantoate--beta-alanine ligase [Luminiphilus sp.]MDG2038332.1 pantoate--beta-alanine ligase [Luminiphilus sp.]
MIVASTPSALKEHLAALRTRSVAVSFVPTMGNLHAGHLALMQQARQSAEVVVASIFVNPMQFAENEDLATYPRTMDADLAALREAGVDMVFTPNVEDIYPGGSALHTAIHVPVLGDSLCGRDRPGHFDGVCTVVCKLFQIVEPDIAVFGEKDLQQLLIIKQMVRDLGLPVEVQHGPTQRAEDGLALSSRNQYLSDAERALAPLLWQTLQDCAQALKTPAISEAERVLTPARDALQRAGFAVDYLELRTLSALDLIHQVTEDCAVFVAARLGRTRLIDNIQILAP